jgi:hypothetical protein
MPRSVPRSEAHLQFLSTDCDPCSGEELPVRVRERAWKFESEPRRLRLHLIVEWEVGGVEKDRGI